MAPTDDETQFSEEQQVPKCRLHRYETFNTSSFPAQVLSVSETFAESVSHRNIKLATILISASNESFSSTNKSSSSE